MASGLPPSSAPPPSIRPLMGLKTNPPADDKWTTLPVRAKKTPRLQESNEVETLKSALSKRFKAEERGTSHIPSTSNGTCISSPLATENRFAALSDTEDANGMDQDVMDAHSLSDSSQHSHHSNGSKVKSQSRHSADSDHPHSRTQTQKRSDRAPPITIYGIPNYSQLISILNNATQGQFTISSNSNAFKIRSDSRRTYDEIINTLKHQDLMFHTFPTDDMRLKKTVIRGLSATVDVELIKNDLKLQDVKFIEIRQLTHRVEQGVRRPMPLFVITTNVHDEGKPIHLVEKICHHRITLERYRGPQGPRQCFNCQQFGHSSAFCTLPPSCFKCALTHKSSDCPKPLTEPALCINCKQSHPASYRKCPAFLQAADSMAPRGTYSSRRINKKTIPSRATPSASVYVSEGATFADMVSNTRRPRTYHSHNSTPPGPPATYSTEHTNPPTNQPPDQAPVWTILSYIAEALPRLSTDPTIALLANLLKIFASNHASSAMHCNGP